jgi:hypothetical protein
MIIVPYKVKVQLTQSVVLIGRRLDSYPCLPIQFTRVSGIKNTCPLNKHSSSLGPMTARQTVISSNSTI